MKPNNMKKIFALLTLFLSLSFATLAQNSLRVMCYNIRFGELMDMKELAEIILSNQADVVLLQEMDVFTNRQPRHVPKAGSTNYMAELMGHTKMHGIFGRTIYYKGGEYGIGILSKYSFEKTQMHRFDSQGKENRGVIEAVVTLPNKTQLRLLSTHLEVSSEAVRNDQMKEINKLFAKDKMPTILAGDFNEVAGNATGCIPIATKVWTPVCPEGIPTIPAKNPKSKIDFVMVKPDSKFKVLESRVLDYPTSSDHCPILTVLEY